MRAGRLAGVALLGLAGCVAAGRPLPRLDRYDFSGTTPGDLAALRQMAPSEGPEGPLARYALARAHADWLVLGLIRDREDDVLLRRLAVDLGVGGATPDDRLELPQVLQVFDAVLAELGEAGAAGPEASAWASATGRLLRGVRDGWEQFSPGLFRAVARASERPGPARAAADLLAVGWGRIALAAVADRPAREQGAMLPRMAAYFDPRVIDALERNPSDLSAAAAPFVCPEARRGARGRQGAEALEALRATCGDDELGLPEGGGAMASPELILAARVLGDLAARRARLAEAGSDPLVVAAAEDLGRFDETLLRVRLPMPLPVPSPGLPAPPVLAEGSTWRPSAVVVVAGAEGEAVALWPVLGVDGEGAPALVDRLAGLGLPGRPVGEGLPAALRAAWATAARSLGVRQRSAALLVPGDAGPTRLVDLVAACEEAGESRVDLVAASPTGRVSTLAVRAGRGAARHRTSGDRRAVAVVEPGSVLVGDADGRWTEVEDEGGALADERVMVALGQHLAGRGVPGLVLALRPGTDATRLAQIIELLVPPPDGGAASREWQVWLDDRDPPAPERAAPTVADALALQRVRLRACYERYLRDGGEAEGLMVLELTVAPEGGVSEGRVLRSELGSQPVLEQCLLGEARRIRFPEAVEGRTVHVPLRLVPERE